MQTFWESVVACMNDVCGSDLPLSAKWCLLNVWDATDLVRIEQIWMSLGGIIAKSYIARLWGAGSAPFLRDWKRNMDWCMVEEKVVYRSRGCSRKWERVWGKLRGRSARN